MADKIFRIVINNKYFFAKYFGKRNAKKLGKTAGWEIEIPGGVWMFDDTVGNMKREIKATYPTALITKVR